MIPSLFLGFSSLFSSCSDPKTKDLAPVTQTSPQLLKPAKDTISLSELRQRNRDINQEQQQKSIVKSEPTRQIQASTKATPVQSLPNEKQNPPTSLKTKKRHLKAVEVIQFEESTYDFDEIVEGDTVDFKFKFKNISSKPLNILKAKATCGCTQPSYPFIATEPGEEGYIGVRYVSVGKDGPQSPKITVETDLTEEIVTLNLIGTVKPKAKEAVSIKDSTHIDSTKIDIIK